MSVVSNRHNVVPFVAGKSTAFENQRLAKVGYKSTKKNPAKFKSVCASVPKIEDAAILERSNDLIPYVRSMLENAQDGIVRSLYESSKGALSSVGDEEISINACIAFLESEATGGRLTKDAVESWFNESLADSLTVVIAEKLGFDDLNEDQAKVVDQHINGYRGVFASLAGGKTLLNPNQIKGCRNALALLSDEDEISVRIVKRLDVMENKENIADLLEL